MNNEKTRNKGFASMSEEQRRSIASLGGKSHSRDHMSEIGRKGGTVSGFNKRLKANKSNEERNSNQEQIPG